MKWSNYVFCFLAGVFLAHFYPHVIHGFSLTNLFWATAALVTGIVFMKLGKLSADNLWTIILVLAGVAVIFAWGTLHHHLARLHA